MKKTSKICKICKICKVEGYVMKEQEIKRG